MEKNLASKTAKKLTGRVGKQQKLRLLELMRENRSVGRGQYSMKSSAIQHEQCWKNVALELNALSGGKKTAEQWKRCWIDWKASVKRQYGKIRAFKNRTGNRPLSEGPKPLEKMDEEIIYFFSEDLVEGDKTTPEAGFPHEMDVIEAGPSTRDDFEDARPSTRDDFEDAGPSTRDYSAAAGPSTRDYSAAAGPSTRDYSAAAGPSTRDDFEDTGTSTRDYSAAAGPSTRDDFEDTGPSTRDYSAAAGPSTRDDFEDAGPSTRDYSAAAGPSTREDSAAAGPSTRDYSAAAGPSTRDYLEDAGLASGTSRRRPTGSSMRSCFEEAKKYADEQNNLILLELRKLNENMLIIAKELREIKEKLN